MHLDLTTPSPAEVYALMTQTIIPRPVAWVVTENDDSSFNLAPYSYFNAISSSPPMVMFSIGVRPDASIKDTRYNLESRPDFVINIAHREMAPALTASSATFGRNESEVEALDLALAEMPGCPVPRLADCRIAYACKLSDVHMIEQQAIVYATLSDLYIADEVVGEDYKGRLKVDASKVDPLGRLGGGEYFSAGDIISIERPA